jgi:hypothetical protein
MLCWEARPAGRWAVPGAQARTHPPIDLRRNATSRAGVTRPQPGHPSGSGADQLNQGHLPRVVSLLVLAAADPSRRVWTWPAGSRGGCPTPLVGLDSR